MVRKGGYFLPLYLREAMWINSHSSCPFAIKIHIGGVNAVSGEPAFETEKTLERRKALLHEKKNIQDYVVVPEQLWLDGTASTEGSVRQFVAMPMGSGYSVEAQVRNCWTRSRQSASVESAAISAARASLVLLHSALVHF